MTNENEYFKKEPDPFLKQLKEDNKYNSWHWVNYNNFKTEEQQLNEFINDYNKQPQTREDFFK